MAERIKVNNRSRFFLIVFFLGGGAKVPNDLHL